jgi:hypothetical protein
MVYSEIFNNVFEGWNLFKKICSENPAAWQCHSAALHTTELSRVLALLTFGDFYHKVQMQQQLTVALSWAFLLKPWLQTFEASIKDKTCPPPRPSPPANQGKMAIREVL